MSSIAVIRPQTSTSRNPDLSNNTWSPQTSHSQLPAPQCVPACVVREYFHRADLPISFEPCRHNRVFLQVPTRRAQPRASKHSGRDGRSRTKERPSRGASSSRPLLRHGYVSALRMMPRRVANNARSQDFMTAVALQCKIKNHHPEWSNVSPLKTFTRAHG